MLRVRPWVGFSLALVVPAIAVGALVATNPKTDEHAHAHGLEDTCGLDAKALSARFEKAREAVRGAKLDTLEMNDLAGAPIVAVRGEINVGLEPGVDPASVAARHRL